MKWSQIRHFTGVKFFALRYGCVEFLTIIMSALMVLEIMISERPKSFKGAEVLRAPEPIQPYYHIPLAIKQYMYRCQCVCTVTVKAVQAVQAV